MTSRLLQFCISSPDGANIKMKRECSHVPLCDCFLFCFFNYYYYFYFFYLFGCFNQISIVHLPSKSASLAILHSTIGIYLINTKHTLE